MKQVTDRSKRSVSWSSVWRIGSLWADRVAALVPSVAPVATEPPPIVPASTPPTVEPSNELPVKAVALSAGETYARRGDEKIAAGDLKAARRLYALGAQAGNEKSAKLIATLAH